MELRQLRSFVAVAEEGNISRAAQRLRLTQPALSRQIKALEEDLGLPLLERGAHSFRLTQEGEVLLREARAVLERADEALKRVRAAGKAVTLRVGYAPSLTVGMLPVAIEAFTQRHPRVRVELHDLSSAEMKDGLQQGRLDVIVTAREGTTANGADWTPLRTEGWRVAMNRRHPLADKAVIHAGQLDGQRMVLFCQKDYPEYWETVTRWFRQQGINATVAGQYDGVTSLASAVEAGLGLGFVAEGTACLLPDRILLKPINPSPGEICIAAGVQKDVTPNAMVQVFLEELKLAAR